MIDARRGLAVRVIAAFCLALATPSVRAQDVAPERLKKEAAEAKKKFDEETDRAAKKRAAVQLEYDALQKPDVRLALAAAIEPVFKKHQPAVRSDATEPGKTSPLEEPITKDCAAAVRDHARNLAEVLAPVFARNVIEAAKKPEEVGFAALVGESLTEAFGDEPSFDGVWRSTLAPVFEKSLRDAEAALAAAQGHIEDAERAAKAKASGAPPGMIEVPGGKYEVGDSKEESAAAKKALGHKEDRKLPIPYWGAPKRTGVTLDGYYLDQNEVTNRYWAEFCRDTGRAPPAHWVAVGASESAPATDASAKIVAPGAAVGPPLPPPVAPVAGRAPFRGTEDVPVTWISYEAAGEYARWLGRRLPTEEEWEVAARMPAPTEKTRRLYPFGPTLSADKPPCNYAGALNDPRVRALPRAKGGNGKDLPALTPVGSWPEGKSALGFNDLCGNVLEMTSSPFLRYPGWAPDKVPPGVAIENEDFSDEMIVMRGGHAAANDLMLLPSVRRGFARLEGANSLVGFRTAVSKARGKDLVAALAEDRLFTAKLSDTGVALKDEQKAGRFPTLDMANAAGYAALMRGGWDVEKNLPAKADWLFVLNRGTKELTDGSRIKSLAKDQKEPLLLGYMKTDVALVKPAVPAGEYWIMWRYEETKDPTTKKTVVINELSLRDLIKKQFYKVDAANPAFVTGSTESTGMRTDKTGTTLNVVLSFLTPSGGKGRTIVEFKLETAPGALTAFK
jgi:formylglycine-generating enzyme required for sulfatase activity